MITEDKKKELIDWISNLENQSMLEHLMELKNTDETEKIYYVSEAEREGIERGMKDLKEGRIKSHDEVKKDLKSKYPRFF
jgi:hypothetical protein